MRIEEKAARSPESILNVEGAQTIRYVRDRARLQEEFWKGGRQG
jgi:hypothetical protein